MEKRIVFSDESAKNDFGYMMSSERCQGHKEQPKGLSDTRPHKCTCALTPSPSVHRLAYSLFLCLTLCSLEYCPPPQRRDSHLIVLCRRWVSVSCATQSHNQCLPARYCSWRRQLINVETHEKGIIFHVQTFIQHSKNSVIRPNLFSP